MHAWCGAVIGAPSTCYPRVNNRVQQLTSTQKSIKELNLYVTLLCVMALRDRACATTKNDRQNRHREVEMQAANGLYAHA